MEKQFTWTDIYSEFAKELLTYKNNRVVLIEIMREVFKEAEVRFYLSEGNNIPLSDIWNV
jgi:hypothetical protein